MLKTNLNSCWEKNYDKPLDDIIADPKYKTRGERLVQRWLYDEYLNDYRKLNTDVDSDGLSKKYKRSAQYKKATGARRVYL